MGTNAQPREYLTWQMPDNAQRGGGVEYAEQLASCLALQNVRKGTSVLCKDIISYDLPVFLRFRLL